MKIKAFLIAMVLCTVAIVSQAQSKFELYAKASGIGHSEETVFLPVINSSVIASKGKIEFVFSSDTISYNVSPPTLVQEGDNDTLDLIIGYMTDEPNTFIYTISCPVNMEEYIIVYNEVTKIGIIFKFRKSSFKVYEQF